MDGNPHADDIATFNALLARARACRNNRQVDEALRHGLVALSEAERIGHTEGVALALESLALAEREAGHIRDAGEYFLRSAQVEQTRGDLVGAAFALSNYGHMLVTQRLEGAEHLLRQALAIAPVGSVAFAAAADNMGSEMERQGLHAAAAAWSAQALAVFERAARPLDIFCCLRNLSRHHQGAGQMGECEAAFERAHTLILQLRRSEVRDEHYAVYPVRVAQVRERTWSLFAQPGRGGGMAIACNELLGQEGLELGMRLLEAGKPAAAVEALRAARKEWEQLHYVDKLISVDNHLAYALSEIGDRDQAAQLSFDALRTASRMGDAMGEVMALSRLVVLRDRLPTEDPLDFIARCLALEPALRRQVDDDPTQGPESGVLSGQAALVCAEAGGDRLAEEYFEQSIAIGRDLAEPVRHRLVYRLVNYHLFLDHAGRSARAAEVLDDLRAVSAPLASGDPRVVYALARAAGRSARATGDQTAAFRLLLDACRAYEEIRARSVGAGSVGPPGQFPPPYEAAAEVAIALERPRLALALLERGKARTLMDTLASPASIGLPLVETDDPPPPALGAVLGLELFVTSTGAGVFIVDGDEVTWRRLIDGDLRELDGLVSRLVDAADDDRSTGLVWQPLDRVLAEATFVELCTELAHAAGHRPVWLAPHRFLHQAPIELGMAVADGANWPQASLVPTLAGAAALPALRPSGSGFEMAIGGDPSGNLPFARVEARLIADSATTPVLGHDCGVAWLRTTATAPRLGVLHIACHGRFDRNHPERSGLLLAVDPDAAPPGTRPHRLVTATEIAALDLNGVVVVLSACSSGLETIAAGDEASGLPTAFLQAGARAIVAARWRIDDLPAMLMMLRFHHELRAGWPDLHRALAAASAAVRELSATSICEQGFALADEVLARGGTVAESVALAAECVKLASIAVGDAATPPLVMDVIESGVDQLANLQRLRPPDDARARRARPFGHPRTWGAFSIIGGGHAA